MPTLSEVEADLRATELVNEMASLSLDHPARKALRDRAIEAWMPLAHRLTRRYANRGENYDDLLQAASVGLIKAVDGYDPSRGVEFVGYAVPTILGSIKRHFRDRTWSMRIPRRLQELRMAINAAQADINNDLRRAPTVADIAARIGASEEDVLEALESGHAYRTIPLSAPVDGDSGLELGDTIGGEDNGYALAEFRTDLPPAMETLTERERQIIMMRFYGNLTQTVIAERIGVSQMHVSRLLSQALAKLRTRMS